VKHCFVAMLIEEPVPGSTNIRHQKQCQIAVLSLLKLQNTASNFAFNAKLQTKYKKNGILQGVNLFLRNI
jgi:hypothetical protein